MRQIPRLFLKADAIPADARWITVHPNGSGSKGQAVLIQPHPDGSARVIGGAGGSLNYLKLRGVKSHSDYQAEAGKKAAEKRAARKEQIAADKASGIHGAKEQARKDIADQRKKAEQSVIQAVAKKAGWETEDLEFPEDDYAHLSEAARDKVRDKFHRDLLKKAKEVIQQSRQMLVLSPAARADAGVGEVPLHSDSPDEVAAADLDPVRAIGAGLGFQADYGGRAEAAGLTKDALAAEATAVKTANLTPEQRQKALAKGEAAKLIQQELEGIKEPAAPKADASLLSAKDALELVKEGKKLALIEKAAREANFDVDKSSVEPKAFVLETTDDVDAAVQEDLANDLRTMQTRAFLSEVGKIAGGKPDETLGGHMGVGAYNSINSLAMAVGGDALVDRSVVDVMGVAGAAQVLARRLHADLTPEEVQHVADGVQDWHVNHYMAASTKALKQARELTDAAAAIDLSEEAKTGADLAVAQELNQRRRAAVGDAQRILGQALGEMEANAALVLAMKGPGTGDFQVSLGTTSPEAAITQVRAIGLQPGDYALERTGGNTFLTVKPAGMARLAKPVAREDIAQVQRNLAIMRGDHDEDGWLPQGVANRPDMLMDVKPGVAERLAQPFQPGADLEASLRTYIGARAADGDAPADILSDVQSADFFQKVGAGRTEEYRAALDAVAPLKGADGKQQRADALADTFDKYADDHVAALGGERTTLNRQKFMVDQHSVDALHRALAETPEATAAYKQIGELTNKDQAALREHFYQHIAREDAQAGAMRKELEAHIASEPEKETTDMFGDTVPNPEWTDWKNHRDGLAAKLNASSLTWGKYLKTMGGNERAYEAVQDVIRSKVASSFVDTHNKLNPDAPLKLGKRTIRNNLDHLDAVDPDAREARLAKDKELVDRLRNRVGGKYASGSVADKIDAAKQEQAAFEQAQMGFFSSEDLFGGDGADDKTPQAAPLGADERHTLGHAAERQIAAMMGHIGQNFKAGQPTKLWGISMSGKYAAQQRAIKLIEANKRVMLAAGAGCVRGDTVLHDAKRLGKTFYEWWISGEAPVVESMSESGVLEHMSASPVFVKGFSKMLKVSTPSAAIVVSENHLFLTDRGWVFARNLSQSDCLIETSSFGVTEARSSSDAEGGLFLRKTVRDCLGRYWRDSHQCDEPLLLEEGSGQFFAQEPACAAGNSHPRKHGDGRWLFALHNQDSLCTSLPSMRGFCGQFAQLTDLSIESQTAEGSGGQLARHTQAGLLYRQLSSVVLQKAREECLYFGRGDLVGKLAKFELLAQPLEREDAALLSSGKDQGLRQFAQQLRAADMCEEQAPGSPVFDGSYKFSPVLSVDDAGHFITFDIHVPVTNNYVANGLVHHNSGKTNMMLGAHAHLAGLGKIKRSIHVVPSIVQGQFSGEALRLLEPGKFKAHIQPGASQAERIAAYKDPDTHICVMTHQSFRDDMIHLGAQHAGVDEAAMTEKLQGMTTAQRKEWVAGVMAKEGINFDASFVDESHDTLNRAGKENSSLANVIEAVGHHTPYHVLSSGDPVKNDASEVHSMLQKMDPERYGDRAAFMRRYGADTIASKDALQREMARYVFPTSITPDVAVSRSTETVKLSKGQQQALGELDKHLARARLAQRAGKVDVEAVRHISPGSFDGVPEDEHEAVAAKLQKAVGVLKSSAVNRIINTHPDNAKVQRAVELVQARPGKQGVIFARNREAVAQYQAAMEKAGRRVVTITGSDSAKEKDRKRRMFNPEQGEAQADVLIASDAGAVGMNLQSGQFLIQHDISQTAKTHSQRNARIHRLGQKKGVELIDLQGDHPEERKSSQRLERKYGLKNMMASPLDGLDDTGVAGAIAARRAAAQSDQAGLF